MAGQVRVPPSLSPTECLCDYNDATGDSVCSGGHCTCSTCRSCKLCEFCATEGRFDTSTGCCPFSNLHATCITHCMNCNVCACGLYFSTEECPKCPYCDQHALCDECTPNFCSLHETLICETCGKCDECLGYDCDDCFTESKCSGCGCSRCELHLEPEVDLSTKLICSECKDEKCAICGRCAWHWERIGCEDCCGATDTCTGCELSRCVAHCNPKVIFVKKTV
jgi:hypothetical protein